MKNIRKDQIEAYCMSQIEKHILNPAKIQEIAAEIAKLAGSTPEKVKADLKAYRAKRTKIAGYLKNMARQEIQEGYIDDIQQELKAEYTHELAEIDLQIVQLEAAAQNAVSVESVTEYLMDLLQKSESMDEEMQKSLFDQLIEKIIVDEETITVYLIVSPFPRFGDKLPSGQPHIDLSPSISRKAFVELY